MTTLHEAVDALESVLCGPNGKCCITGSPEDRAIVGKSIATLRKQLAQPDDKDLLAIAYMDGFHAGKRGALAQQGAV